MGTVTAQSTVGEPLLATGTPNVTDMTFRQLRQFSRILPGLPANGGVQNATDCAVTNGAGASVDVAAGYVWIAGTVVTGRDGQNLYGVPITSTVNLAAIPSPAASTRRDLVVVRVYDEGDAPGSGIAAEGRVQYIRNAAETTVAEAAPANSFVLAYVDVTTAGVKTITDRRWTLPVLGAQLIGGYAQAITDSAGAGDKLGPLTIMGDGVTPVQVEARLVAELTAAASQQAHAELRDAAGGAGTIHGKDILEVEGGSAVETVLNPEGTIPAFTGSKTIYLRLIATSGTINAADGTRGHKRILRATWAPGYSTS